MAKQKFAPQLPGPATIRQIGEGTTFSQHDAVLQHCAGKIMKLTTPEALPVGAPVRVEVSGGLVLGEVVNRSEEGSDYVTYIEICQVIPSVSDLAKLVSAVLGDRRAAVSPAEQHAVPSEAAQVPASGSSSR